MDNQGSPYHLLRLAPRRGFLYNSLAKTQVKGLFIHNYKLEVIHEFVYLGSTITDNLSIDSELNKRIGQAAMTLSRLIKRVWSNNKPSDYTKVNLYKVCVISTLLYGSESWTKCTHQEKRLNVFYMLQTYPRNHMAGKGDK